jgi:MFS transporter, SP family, arabinose:H+ symporter
MENQTSDQSATYNLVYVYSICLVATLGGLMFGFDLGIITGVVPYIEHQFSLSGFSLGLVVAIFELGAMTGALITARVADKYGRKKTMIACALLLSVTALGVAFAGGAALLALWRFAQGLCVGAASVLSPMYIAEVAPAKVRGRLVSFNQLSIILGILIASVCNFYFGDNDLNSPGWRYMFLSALVPSVIFLILLFFIPESPRWLVLQSDNDSEADRIFLRINKGNESYSRAEIDEIRNSVSADKSRSRVSLNVLFGRTFLPIVLVGFTIAFLQ